MTGYLRKCNYLFIILLTICFINGCSNNPNLLEISNQKDIRLNELEKLEIKTEKYKYNCDNDELDLKFDKMSSDRWKVYFVNPEDYGKKDVLGIYKKEYQTPENWKSWNSRYPYPLAFKYNLAYEYYNASIILAYDYKFLAIEAPSSKNISEFYNLFDIYDVDSFIKLNSPDEYNEDYYPFWQENKEDDNHIKINDSHINFYSYEWPHRQGADTYNLLKLIKSVQIDFNKDKFMAVSCRAGAGRTGTFIASYIIIDKINEQVSKNISLNDIDLNIDRIVWEMSIQRPFAITHKDQYKTLYRLADLYIKDKIDSGELSLTSA